MIVVIIPVCPSTLRVRNPLRSAINKSPIEFTHKPPGPLVETLISVDIIPSPPDELVPFPTIVDIIIVLLVTLRTRLASASPTITSPVLGETHKEKIFKNCASVAKQSSTKPF